MEPTWILSWLSEEFVHLFRLEQTHNVISPDYLREENGWITYCDLYRHEIRKVKVKQSHNRPWRPIGLRDVKDPTLSRQSAHRWG
jgi:hypothetical protein